jgi:hypothetical protein
MKGASEAKKKEGGSYAQLQEISATNITVLALVAAGCCTLNRYEHAESNRVV